MAEIIQAFQFFTYSTRIWRWITSLMNTIHKKLKITTTMPWKFIRIRQMYYYEQQKYICWNACIFYTKCIMNSYTKNLIKCWYYISQINLDTILEIIYFWRSGIIIWIRHHHTMPHFIIFFAKAPPPGEWHTFWIAPNHTVNICISSFLL